MFEHAKSPDFIPVRLTNLVPGDCKAGSFALLASRPLAPPEPRGANPLREYSPIALDRANTCSLLIYMASVAQLLKSSRSGYNASPGKFDVIKLPAYRVISYSSKGDPYNNDEFSWAVEQVYQASLEAVGKNIMPLECTWYTDKNFEFDYSRKKDWHWKIMIRQPDRVTAAKCKKVVAGRKKITTERINEGLVMQTLHLGPYLTERPTYGQLLQQVLKQGYEPTGPLHEIFLSDPTKTRPGDLKTIVRKPVKKRRA